MIHDAPWNAFYNGPCHANDILLCDARYSLWIRQSITPTLERYPRNGVPEDQQSRIPFVRVAVPSEQPTH